MLDRLDTPLAQNLFEVALHMTEGVGSIALDPFLFIFASHVQKCWQLSAGMLLESTLWTGTACTLYIDRKICRTVAYNFRLLLTSTPVYSGYIHTYYIIYCNVNLVINHVVVYIHIVTPSRISSHSKAELLERLLGAIEG